MKIEISFLAGLLFSGTTLLWRIQIYGFEQALVSAVIEQGVKGVKNIRRLLPNRMRIGR